MKEGRPFPWSRSVGLIDTRLNPFLRSRLESESEWIPVPSGRKQKLQLLSLRISSYIIRIRRWRVSLCFILRERIDSWNDLLSRINPKSQGVVAWDQRSEELILLWERRGNKLFLKKPRMKFCYHLLFICFRKRSRSGRRKVNAFCSPGEDSCNRASIESRCWIRDTSGAHNKERRIHFELKVLNKWDLSNSVAVAREGDLDGRKETQPANEN